jgi:hypothetical protein
MTETLRCIMGATITKPGDIQVIDIYQQKNWSDIFRYSDEVWGYGNESEQDAITEHKAKFHVEPVVVYRLLSAKGKVIGYFCPVLKAPRNEQAIPSDQRPGVD